MGSIADLLAATISTALQSGTLQSKAIFHVLDLVSEGEIVGLVDTAHPLRSVFFDDVVVESPAGLLNYKGVDIVQRLGTHIQTPIPGFSSVESPVILSGTEIEFGIPLIFQVSDSDINAVRITIAIPNLSRQSGNSIVGNSVVFKLSTQAFGQSFIDSGNQTITGKAISTFQQQYTIPLNGPYPVNVKVTRISADSTVPSFQNKIIVSNYTEIQGVRLSYPDSAIMGIVLDSEQLGGKLPRRSYDIRGIKVLVPTGYNPVTRTYPSFWNGTFTRAWSDNPAWVLYDILTNRRYGLGDFILPSQVDKYGLYAIARYCDGLVPTGFGSIPISSATTVGTTATVVINPATLPTLPGGLNIGGLIRVAGAFITGYNGVFNITSISEFIAAVAGFRVSYTVDTPLPPSTGGTAITEEPRFTFNTIINDRRDAFEVVNAIASVFRGIAYWSSGAIGVSADSPKDFTRLVVPADVVNGDFNYTGSALKSRHAAVMVSWNDPSDNYKQTIEVVEDQELITKYGFRTLELAAFACTSRGQANRVGRWLLDSEKNETETITFTGGFDFADVRPGEIVAVADPSRQGPRLGGRVVSFTGGSNALVLDAPYSPVAGDAVYLMTVSPGGTCSTAGTAVTGTSGQSFVGLTGNITINGITYSIASVTNATSLTLNDSAGTQTTVKWSHPFTADRVETINLTPGTTGTTVTLASAPLGTVQPDAIYIIRSSTVEPETWRVISVSESEGGLFAVTALKYDGTKFARIEASVNLTPPPTSFLPTGPLLPPTNLVVVESLYRTNDPGGTTFTLIDIGWTASTDPRVLFYQVQARPPNPDGTASSNNYTIYSNGPSTAAQISGADAIPGVWSFRISGSATFDNSAGQGPFLELTQTVVGKTEPPPNVTGLIAVRDYDTVTLSWSHVSVIDLLGYDVRVGAGSWETATVIATGIVSTTLLIVAEVTDTQVYQVRARDELGTLSVGVASVVTNYPTIPPITGMMLFQTGTSVRILWTPSSPGSPHIRYEIRMSLVSAVWETSALIGRVDGPPFIATASVGVVTTQRYRIKPFVESVAGVRVYGTEVFADIVKFPLIDNSLLFSKDEHTAFTGTKSASMEVVSGQLALKVGETFGTYTYVVDLGAQLRGRLFYAATALNLSNTELLIDNATMLIDDANFLITPVSNSGVPNIRYFLQSFTPAGTEVEFFEADYDFQTVTVRVEFRREIADDFRPALSALTTFFNDFVMQ